MIRRAWGNLTSFGRSLALFASVVVMAWALVFGMALREYASAAPPAPTPGPLVLAVSIETLTSAPDEPAPLAVVRESAAQTVQQVTVPTWLTAAEVRGIAREVSGSPIWAAWAAQCWSGESGRGDLYQVDAVSPVNADGSRDWGLPQLNDLAWAKHGLDGPRAAADPVYAIRFAWEVVMQEQGVGAWNAEGCRG